MKLEWTDAEHTMIRRQVSGGTQFIPATTDNQTYLEEILPWLAAGNGIGLAPENRIIENFDPSIELNPQYSGFRVAIALCPEYERILDAIAQISPTQHSSIVGAWAKVEDVPSLEIAAMFWNLKVVPEAQITSEESSVIQNLAQKFNIPIKVGTNGLIQVIVN